MSNKEGDLLTAAGLEKLQEDIQAVEERLSKVRSGKSEAAQMGNLWHDNFGFESLERDERMLMHRLAELRGRLRRGKVIEASLDVTSVAIGSMVEVEIDGTSKQAFTLGGYGEGNPQKGIISYQSPLGKAILGAVEGEERVYKVREQQHKVRVCNIT